MNLFSILLIINLYFITKNISSLHFRETWLFLDLSNSEESKLNSKSFIKDSIISFSKSEYLLGKDKPNLTIDTNPSTGNEGLDAEKKWREKSAYCEHEEISIYEADENDNTDPMLCDFIGDSEEIEGQSTIEQHSAPKKHPAVVGEGDWAYVCNNCQAVICKDCNVNYPSEENSVVYSPIPEEFLEKEEYNNEENSSMEKNSSSENINSEEEKLRENNNNTAEEILSSSNRNINDTSNASLIDDFANTDCEMPDYTGGDD